MQLLLQLIALSLGGLMATKKNTSRLQSLEANLQELKVCVENKDMNYLDHYERIIELVDQYLDFDPLLPKQVSNLLTESYLQIFHAIRYYAQGQNFQEIYQGYLKYSSYLNKDIKRAEICADLSYILWMFNDLDSAITQGKASIDILEEIGNINNFTGRYSNVGFIYESNGQLDQAFNYYQLGMQYGLKINNEEVLSLAYTGLGRISAMRGKLKQAIHFFLEAKKRIEDQSSDNYLSICNNLGIAYGSIGNHEEALTYFEPFLSSKLRESDPDTYITMAINSANCYRVLHNNDKAEKLLKEALACANSLEYYNDKASIMINLANLKIKQQQFTSALKLYNSALNCNSDTDDKRHKLVILQGIAISNMGLKKYSKSLPVLKEAQALAEELNLQNELAKNHSLLSEIFEIQDNIKESYKHYKLASEIKMKQKNEEYKAEIKAIKEDYEKPQKTFNSYNSYANTSLISQELQKLLKSPLIGSNAQMQNVIYQAMMVANSDKLPVLIIGETGTGKEAIARLIHYASQNKGNPFISVNSAAFATSLIESAFFGSEKGSFTGSANQQIGYFEAAHTGSLFLDEIGDMPLKMQSKFLRVIEEKVINRIGSTKDIKVDFRLISATNKDLSAMALANNFRFDLLNRINVMEIQLPPLRERQDDIPLLIDYYLNTLSINQGLSTPIITKEAFDLLVAYDYPGNIRELKNILQRALLLSNSSVIDVDSISLPRSTCNICDNHPDLPSLNLAECEAYIIERALKLSNNLQKKAAELLGITPYSLSRKLKKMREKENENN
jgi:transcriptional regulator with PAS, ATPase and Fis domain